MAWCQRCDDKYLIISSPKVGAGGIVICDLLLFSHSVMFNSATSWTAACQVSLTLTISWSLLKLKSIESVMPSSHLILVVPFSSCLQSFPASGSFLMSQLFASGDQGTGASASASVLPMNIQGCFPSYVRLFNGVLSVSDALFIFGHCPFFLVSV